jgi:hypothetical protein
MRPHTLPTRFILTHDFMITHQGYFSKNVPGA